MSSALRKFAGPAGAEFGVMPIGIEQTHGTDRVQYAKRPSAGEPAPSVRSTEQANDPQYLWDNFSSYDKIGPGRADGTFGTETIG